MSDTYISAALRRLVIERAGNCCEYCLLSQSISWWSFEIDHVISEKHDGETIDSNLCLSCYRCNAYKGSDIAGADPLTGTATFLYNPRQQNWGDHFRLAGATIVPLTPEGRLTIKLLRLNASERIDERILGIAQGAYPCLGRN